MDRSFKDNASRNLCIPKLLVSINDVKNSISQVSILENYMIFLSDNILLMKNYNDSNNSNNNIENITKVIDENQYVGSIGILYKNAVEIIFTISLSGYLFGFIKDIKNDVNFKLYKLFELPYYKHEKDNIPILTIDVMKSLLIIISSNMMYFLTIDFNKINQSEESILGVVSFPIKQKILYPMIEIIENIILPKDVINYCSIWGTDNNKEMVVCSGNGIWLDIWPLRGIFEDEFSTWELEYSNYESIRIFSDHNSWITSLSNKLENVKASFYVTGDAQGDLQFWRCKKRATTTTTNNNNNDNEQRILQKLFKCNASMNSPITSILIDGIKIWVGDDSGSIFYYQVELKNEKIIKLKHIETSNISGPTYFQWNNTNNHLEGRLRSFSCNSGTLYEYIIHDSIATVMKAWPDPSSLYWHKSQVEVCFFVDEWDILITAGTSNAIFLWDINNCKLISTIPSPDNFCTSISAYAQRKFDKDIIRIFIGHNNGHTQEYSVILPTTNTDATIISDNPNRTFNSIDIDKYSVVSKISNDAPEMIQMDILDVVQFEPDINDNLRIPSSVINKLDGNDNAINTIIPPPTLDSSIDRTESIGEYMYELVSITEYCPMPVTDILTSDLKYYIAFCYSRRCLIIHDYRDNLALLQLQFDDSLIDISKVAKSNNINLYDNDSFTLILLGKTSIKILDAISKTILVSYDLNSLPHGENIIHCALWDSIISKDIYLHKIEGIIITHGLGIYSFDDINGCCLLKEKYDSNDTTTNNIIALDQLVLGIKAHDYNESPLTSIWMMRKLLLLRLKLNQDSGKITINENKNIQIIKSFEYNIDDIKTRIIFSKSLVTSERKTMYRSIVVLSDGTVCVLRI